MNKEIAEFAILALIAATTSSYFKVLPAEYAKVNPDLIWAIVLTEVLIIAAQFLKDDARQMAMGMYGLAFLNYFVIRAISFLGLEFSFRAFARDHDVELSSRPSTLAWLAAFGDLVLIVGIIVAGIVFSDGSRDQRLTYVLAESGAVLLGFVFTIFFLRSMSKNKERVAKYLKEQKGAK